jgi:hypothetical protein
MSTRANITIIQDCFPKKVYFELTSSGYPSHVLDTLVNFCTEHIIKQDTGHGVTKRIYNRISEIALRDLVVDLCPSISVVGNPSYIYEIDLVKGTFKAWNTRTKWVNAPLDWKERGWNCWLGNNNKYGYPTWCKNKLLVNFDIFALENLTEIKCDNEVIKIK